MNAEGREGGRSRSGSSNAAADAPRIRVTTTLITISPSPSHGITAIIIAMKMTKTWIHGKTKTTTGENFKQKGDEVYGAAYTGLYALHICSTKATTHTGAHPSPQSCYRYLYSQNNQKNLGLTTCSLIQAQVLTLQSGL